MYIREVHAERDVATLQAFIRENVLGTFTTAIPHATVDTLQSTHIPWVLSADEGKLGVLRGHIARVNPQSKVMIDATQTERELTDDVLVLFTSPVNSYVTPRWMADTKLSTGKVTPTWQFGAAQVYGRARVYHKTSDPATDAFLQAHLEALTHQHESRLPGKEWEVSEAPESYNTRKKLAIIGIEVEITKIEGRFKVGQDETDGDWRGIRDGFKKEGTDLGDAMVNMMEERGKSRPGISG
ncbi:hypothetical protein DXG03_001815 [Asterophora parasitica]|uniref:Transcriptional regulator n=1 Tax=Asterophora parasitica TaxID=117018 RepID=A0A9P7G958_9AGAR|nr:hypothetical protein DXG03_001815 [Asterophora parasitica]